MATLFLALDPVVLLHTPLVIAETLQTALLSLCLIVSWKAVRDHESSPVAMSGLLWSVVAMVKPVSLYFPFLLSWRWIRHPKIMGLFLICAYLLPGLWIARNYTKAGFPGFTSLGGSVLLQCPAASIESFITGQSLSQTAQELFGRVTAEHPAGFANQIQESRAYANAAWVIMRAHPWLLLRVHLHGATRILFGSGIDMIVDILGLDRSYVNAPATPGIKGVGTLSLLNLHPWLFPFFGVYLLALAGLYLLFLLGCQRLWRRGDRFEALFIGLATVYFVAIASHQGYYRFRIPTMPFLITGAAFFFRNVADSKRS